MKQTFGFSSDITFLHYILPLIAYCAGLAFFISYSPLVVTGFPLDDAWIHRVYSSSFAFGKGLAYNSGIQETGSTSPLWVIVTAPAHWLSAYGIEVPVVKIIAALFGAGSLLLIVDISFRLSGSKTAGLLAGILLAIEPRLLHSTFAGMETVLLVFLWLASLKAVLERRWKLSAFLLGLMAVTRPEALLLIPLILLMPFNGMNLKEWSRSQSLRLLLALLPFAAWGIFTLYVNGHLFPNSYYHKGRAFHFGLEEIKIAGDVLFQRGYSSLTLFVAGMASFVTFLLAKRNFHRFASLAYMVAAPVIFFIAVNGTRGIDPTGYYWTRYLDPATLVMTAAFCAGIGFFFDYIYRKISGEALSVKSRVAYLFTGIAVALWSIYSIAVIAGSLKDQRHRMVMDTRVIEKINVTIGKWINENLPHDAVVAVTDAGAIKYFGKRFTVDMLGINNSDVLFRWEKVKKLYRRPEWIAVYPIWFRLYQKAAKDYTPIFETEVPWEEYSLCNCPTQTKKIVYRRNY